jgi:peptide/nickel transport system permease protein
MSCRPTHLGGDLHHRLGLCACVAGGLVAVLLLPSLLSLDAYKVDLTAVLQVPGLSHVLGTDENGRDVLARLLVGGRGTLGIALVATLVAVLLGTTIGGIAGYRGGVLDALLMRGVDLALAFPSLFAILLVSAILPAGPLLLIGLIGATGWMPTARLVRARVQTLLGTAYVEAARALGVSDRQVLWRHLVPNLVDLLLVSGLVQLSRSILAEATISFLGFGVQPPAPTWGNLLMGAQNYVYTAPWLALAPGLAITGTLLVVSGLGVGGSAGRHRHRVTAISHDHEDDDLEPFGMKRSVTDGRDRLSSARR